MNKFSLSVSPMVKGVSVKRIYKKDSEEGISLSKGDMRGAQRRIKKLQEM